MNEYSFTFRCKSNKPTTLSVPAGLKWAEGKVVTTKAGKRYEGSIIDNVIVLIEV